MKLTRSAALAVTAAAVTALALAACSASATDEEPAASAAGTASATLSGSPASQDEATDAEGVRRPGDDYAWANPDAPDLFKFVATDLVSGEEIDGTSLLYKDVVMWFWASWCPICNAEAGAIVNAMPDFPEDVYVIGIGGQSDAAQSQTFIADHPGVEAFPHIYDNDGQIWSDFGAISQPTLVLINQDGQSQTYAGGYGKWDIIEKVAWLGEN